MRGKKSRWPFSLGFPIVWTRILLALHQDLKAFPAQPCIRPPPHFIFQGISFHNPLYSQLPRHLLPEGPVNTVSWASKMLQRLSCVFFFAFQTSLKQRINNKCLIITQIFNMFWIKKEAKIIYRCWWYCHIGVIFVTWNVCRWERCAEKDRRLVNGFNSWVWSKLTFASVSQKVSSLDDPNGTNLAPAPSEYQIPSKQLEMILNIAIKESFEKHQKN